MDQDSGVSLRRPADRGRLAIAVEVVVIMLDGRRAAAGVERDVG